MADLKKKIKENAEDAMVKLNNIAYAAEETLDRAKDAVQNSKDKIVHKLK